MRYLGLDAVTVPQGDGGVYDQDDDYTEEEEGSETETSSSSEHSSTETDEDEGDSEDVEEKQISKGKEVSNLPRRISKRIQENKKSITKRKGSKLKEDTATKKAKLTKENKHRSSSNVGKPGSKTAAEIGTSSTEPAVIKRGRGRPRKHQAPPSSSSHTDAEKKPSHSNSSKTSSISRKGKELNISTTLLQEKDTIVFNKYEFGGQQSQQHDFWSNSRRMTRRNKDSRVYHLNNSMKIKPKEVHVQQSTNLRSDKLGRATYAVSSDTSFAYSSLDEGEKGPVICSKCKMTYKNSNSLQRHLPTCNDASTSSDSSNNFSSEDEDESSEPLMSTEGVQTEEAIVQPPHQVTFADVSIGVDLDQEAGESEDSNDMSSEAEEQEELEEVAHREDIDHRKCNNRLQSPQFPSPLQEQNEDNRNSFDNNYRERENNLQQESIISGVSECNPGPQIPLQVFAQQQQHQLPLPPAPEQQRTPFAWTTNTNSSSTLVTFQDPTTGQLYRLSVPIQGAQSLSSQTQKYNTMADFSHSASTLQPQPQPIFSSQQQHQQPLQQHNILPSSGLHNLGLTHSYGSDTCLGLYPRTALPATYQPNNVHFLNLNPHSPQGHSLHLGSQTFQSMPHYQQPTLEAQQLASSPSSHSLRTLPMQIQYSYPHTQLQQDRINYTQQQQLYETLQRRQVMQTRYPVSDASSQLHHSLPHPSSLLQQQPPHPFESPVASSSTPFLNTSYGSGSFQQGQSSHYPWQQQTLIEPPKSQLPLNSPQPIRAMPTNLYSAGASVPAHGLQTHYLSQGTTAATLTSPNKIVAPNNCSMFPTVGANVTEAPTYKHMQNQPIHEQFLRCSQENLDTAKLLTAGLPPNFRLSIQQPQGHSNFQFLTLPNNTSFNGTSCVKQLSNDPPATTGIAMQDQSHSQAYSMKQLSTQTLYDCLPQNTQESSNSRSLQETAFQRTSIVEANSSSFVASRREIQQVLAPTVYPSQPQPQINLSSEQANSSTATLPVTELPSSSQWNLSGTTGFFISQPQYLPSTPESVSQPEMTKRSRMPTLFPRPIEPKPTAIQADQIVDPTASTSKTIKSQLASIILEKQQQSISLSIPQDAQTFLRKNPVLTAVVRPMEHPLQQLSAQISQIESTFQTSGRSNVLLNFRPTSEAIPSSIPVSANTMTSGNTNDISNVSQLIDNCRSATSSNFEHTSVGASTMPQAKRSFTRSDESNERKNHHSGSSSSDVSATGPVASSIRLNFPKTHTGDCLVKELSGIGENKNKLQDVVNLFLKTENGERKHIVITPKIHMIPIPQPKDDETDCNLTISEDSSGSSSPTSLEGSTSGPPSQALVRVAVVYEVSHQNSVIFQSNDVRLIWSSVWHEENHGLPPLSYPETTISLEDKEGPSTTFSLKTLVHRAVQFFLQHVGTTSKLPQIPVTQKSSSEGSDNITGCCRTEGYQMPKEKNPLDIFRWLENKFRKPPPFPPVANDDVRTSCLPISMRYRLYKSRPKNLLTVMWSTIHGKGLYTRRDIEKGDIVVEYSGEVIRSLVCEQREKYYQARNIGCYMFRINDEFVVDATLKGNAARFINHSCDPNCESRTVRIGNTELILICTLRRIMSGEELTYDYKFTVEDDQHKIKCGCRAKRCKRYLN